jgi:4-diphosphocytidyl-2-C-methyl-D-erythritol kinase
MIPRAMIPRAMIQGVTSVTVRTPAKINLCLGVGAPQSDGYHPLATVYQAVGLYDVVRAAPAGNFSVRVHGGEADLVPEDDSNLAVRAARLLAADYGVADGVELHIDKGIPVAGGLAGGSSDAAAALVACRALWGLPATRADLLGLAARLGSDVPFCLLGGTAAGTGRGEVVTPVPTRGRYSWVLGIAECGLSTPEVYAEVDRLRGDEPVPPPSVPDALLAALGTGDATSLGAVLANDLEPAALSLRPGLATTLKAGVGAVASLVSGSGPTVLFLAADDEHGAQIAGDLVAAGLCRTVRQVPAPVPGARVIA